MHYSTVVTPNRVNFKLILGQTFVCEHQLQCIVCAIVVYKTHKIRFLGSEI